VAPLPVWKGAENLALNHDSIPEPSGTNPLSIRTELSGPTSVPLEELILTYLLTPWCSPSWEANWFAASQEIPSFHGRFITALTSFRHLSLSWVSPIQSIYPRPTSWRSSLILFTHLRLGLPVVSFPPVSPARPYTPPVLTHTRHMPSSSHSSRFYHPHSIGWGVQII